MECSVITTLIDLALMYGLLSYHLSILSQAQQGWRYIRLSGGSHSAKYFSKWNYHQALGKPYKSWEQTWHSPLPSPLTTTTGIVTAPILLLPCHRCHVVGWYDEKILPTSSPLELFWCWHCWDWRLARLRLGWGKQRRQIGHTCADLLQTYSLWWHYSPLNKQRPPAASSPE